MSQLALQLIAQAKKENWKSLDLGRTGLREIPEEVFELTELEELRLSNYVLNLEKGKWIESQNTGAYNLLHELPEGIKRLKKLTKLYVGGFPNRWEIKDISILKDLTNLQSLDLRSNNISDISILKDLTNLQSLDLRSNNISDISILKDLTNLQSLYLSSNNISDISPLRYLIEKGIPVTFKEYGSGIRLYECPVTIPPKEIAEEGNEAIIRYFQEIDRKGTSFIYEAKLLLVGEGGVGKTSLRVKLADPDALLPKKEERTRGIDVVRLPIEGKNKQPFYMNVWDFGGQDIYHATHRFFLTRRSLYVLLTETRRQDDNFDYWIPNIHLFGGNSPTLVVNNKMEGFPRTVSIGAFRKNDAFNIPENISEVNLKNGEGLEKLRASICHHIQQLPLVGNPVPTTWLKVREALNELSQQKAYISYQDFENICKDKDITEPLKISDLGKYLHDLGVILWYHDIKVLKHKVILQPTWATDAVYLIIDDTIIQENKGHFCQADIERVWADATYANMHDELLALMDAFRLCYQKKNQDAYIIPSMLRPDEPDDIWDEKDNVRLHYEYEFMPKGLANQLTAEMHLNIASDEKVWSQGVVLERNGSEVKVVENRGDKKLTLSARGFQPDAFLYGIQMKLEEIHAGYSGIDVQIVVPCSCNHCLNNKKRHSTFEFDELTDRLKRGKSQIRCNKSDEDLDIQKILGRVGITPVKMDEEGNEWGAIYINRDAFTKEETPKPDKLKVFISYSKSDKDKIENELKPDLKNLERQDKIATWYDGDLLAGSEWDAKIKQKLQEADIVLLMVSRKFIATDYIWDVEIGQAINKHNKGEAVVIPIILSPCVWTGKATPFSKLSALPQKGKPISKHEDQDEAWTEVLQGIKKVINQKLNQ